MIVVKDTDIGAVIKNIHVERGFFEGLKENVALIKDSTEGVYEEIAKYILNTPELKILEQHVRKNVSSKHDLLDAVAFSLENAISMLNFIEAKFTKSNVKLFDTSTITFKQKGLFDWISTLGFFGKYSALIIDIVLTQPKSVKSYLNKVDNEFFIDEAHNYNNILKKLCLPLKEIVRSIEKLSDEHYDTHEESLIEQIKGREAVNCGVAPHDFNPLYWVRYYLMTRDVKTIKSNHEKIDMYALKLQKLENRRNQTPDPSVDRQIEYWENKIQLLDAEIADIEEKYHVNV